MLKVPPLSQQAAWNLMNSDAVHVFRDPHLLVNFIIHNCRTIMNNIMKGLRQYVNNLPYISCRYSICDKPATPADEVNLLAKKFRQMPVTFNRKQQQYCKTLALSKILQEMHEDGTYVQIDAKLTTPPHMGNNLLDDDELTVCRHVNGRWKKVPNEELGEMHALHYDPTKADDDQEIDGPFILNLLQNHVPPDGWGSRWIPIPKNRFVNSCVTGIQPSTGLVQAYFPTKNVAVRVPLKQHFHVKTSRAGLPNTELNVDTQKLNSYFPS